MGWKNGGNSGDYNNKQGQRAEIYNTDKVVNTEHQSQQDRGLYKGEEGREQMLLVG